MTAPSLREAAQMALEALEMAQGELDPQVLDITCPKVDAAIEALRARLALPDAEPAMYCVTIDDVPCHRHTATSRSGAEGIRDAIIAGTPPIKLRKMGIVPLYTAPQPAPVEPAKRPENCGTSFCSCIECVMPVERKPLTDDEILAIGKAIENRVDAYDDGIEFARAIIAADRGAA